MASHSERLALSLATCCIVVSPVFADSVARPDPAMEARTAQAISNLEAPIRHVRDGFIANDKLMQLAVELAKLGRLERALQLADAMPIKYADAYNSAPSTRDEVLRITVRRRCLYGNIAGAEQLIPAIKNSILCADALLTVARARLRGDDTTAARRLLYRVSPLVPHDLSTLNYTAFLLSKTTDRDAAMRLFKRVIAALPPKGYINPREDLDFEKRYRREQTARYLLKSGFVDEWEKVIDSSNFPQSTDDLKMLAQWNRLDAGLRVARTKKVPERVIDLTSLAFTWKSNPDLSRRLMQEAEADYAKYQEARASASSKDDSKGRQQWAPLTLSLLNDLLGDSGLAEKYFEEALKGTTPEEALNMRAVRTMGPLTIALLSNHTVAAADLRRIDANVTPILLQMKDKKAAYYLLKSVFDALMAADETATAHAEMPLLERFALEILTPITNANDLSGILDVAVHWRRFGEEVKAQALLKKIDNLPVPQPVVPRNGANSKSPVNWTYSRRDGAHQMISRGFVKEGRAILASLPVSKARAYSPSILFWEVKYAPHTFPDRVERIADPDKRLEALREITTALTEEWYQQDGEGMLAHWQTGNSWDY